jgi:hypothetical protein
MRIANPWPLLGAVRHFRVSIETYGESGPQVAHVGTGHLRIMASASVTASRLVWYEEGSWVAGSLAGLQFHNTTEWRCTAGKSILRLSHLRRGTHSPTFLAALVPGPSGTWLAEAPHACGADLYLPTLTWGPKRLLLVWEVRSPSDPYSLRFEAWKPAA